MGSVLSKKKSKDSKYAVRQVASLNQSNKTSSSNVSSTEQKCYNINNSTKQRLKGQRPASMPPNNIQVLSLEKYNTSRSTLSTVPTSDINYSCTNSSQHKSSYNENQRHNDEAAPSNIYQSSFYLPDDWDSKEYHYNLHFALKALFGGNVTPSVAPTLKKGSRVIQMGLCSGPWLMDMATNYPSCQFTGVELGKDLLHKIPAIPNISFAEGDIFQSGLPFGDSSIDYIHVRGAGTIISLDKWPALFKEISRVLKPEGVVRIEDVDHSPTGSVMVESFMETVKSIVVEMNQDPEIARKYGNMLQSQGFQIIESKKKRVYFASDGKLSQEFVSSVLNAYQNKAPIIAPKLGLDFEDYRHRIETIFSDCVRINAHMDWYSWVGKKATSSDTTVSI